MKAKPAQRSYKRPTIGDVAAMAGVARPTVSAILNNRQYCYASKETRERVQKAAAKLGYRPSPAAHALHGKRTATIGLIAYGFHLEPTALKYWGFEAEARAAGRITIMVGSDNIAEREDAAIRELMDRYVDALVLYPVEHGPHKELRRLAESGFPVVTFDGAGRLDFDCDDVSVAHEEVGRTQAQHLIEIGRRRACLLTTVERCYVNDRKAEGFLKTFAEAGLTAEHIQLPMPRRSAQHWLTEELTQVRDMLRDHARRFDCMAVHGDTMAMAVIRHAVAMGIRVPDDLAVIGTDDLAASSQNTIPLSTVSHDPIWIGRKACEMVSRRLDGSASDQHVRLVSPVTLVARESTIGRSAPSS